MTLRALLYLWLFSISLHHHVELHAEHKPAAVRRHVAVSR